MSSFGTLNPPWLIPMFSPDVFLVFPRVADVLIRLDHSLQPLFVEFVDDVCCVLDFRVSRI